MPIHKRVSKTGTHYTAVVRPVGQPSKSETFRSRVEAKRWLTAEQKKIDDGEKIASRQVREATLRDLLPLYAEKVAAKTGRFAGRIAGSQAGVAAPA